MKIHHDLPAANLTRGAVVAIGFFDGFHRGHRAIVRELMRERRPGERTAILTFRNHPIDFLRPGQGPALLTTLEERLNALAWAGIDETFLLRFDAELAALSPAEFLDRVLIGRIGARAMVVGQNFRFGAKRAGDVEFAQAYIEARGVRFRAVANEHDAGERISSTRIRSALAAGDMSTADRLLGAAYTIRGLVGLGFGRGHDLGFPTANIVVPAGKALPPDAIYRIAGRYDGRDYAGLVSIGTNPTFAGAQRSVEAWLMDFSGSLYGEELAIRDFRFVREQHRFENVDDLHEQMRADAAAVRFPSFT